MNIFLDTNILLEYFCNRSQAETVENILRFIRLENNNGYISIGSFYTMTYILDTNLKKENIHNPERLATLREILKGILAEYKVVRNVDLYSAVSDTHFSDLEDSYQYRSALAAGCEVLLTLNERDFKDANQNGITILTPQQFVSQYL